MQKYCMSLCVLDVQHDRNSPSPCSGTACRDSVHLGWSLNSTQTDCLIRLTLSSQANRQYLLIRSNEQNGLYVQLFGKQVQSDQNAHVTSPGLGLGWEPTREWKYLRQHGPQYPVEPVSAFRTTFSSKSAAGRKQREGGYNGRSKHLLTSLGKWLLGANRKNNPEILANQTNKQNYSVSQTDKSNCLCAFVQ
jgi:hypothetical protein